MPDLDESLNTVVANYRPREQPAFAEILGRRRRQRTRRAAATGGVAIALALTAALTVPSLLPRASNPPAGIGTFAPSPAASNSTPPATAAGHKCPQSDPKRNPSGDYADVLVLAGKDYLGTGRTAPASSIAGQLGTVVCSIARSGAGPYHMIDFDATFLPTGTRLFALRGTDPRISVAAEVDGKFKLYEMLTPTAAARTGNDVFPGLGKHVVAISLLSEGDGKTELGRISAPATVARMVDELMAAPYTPMNGSFGDPDMFLGLVLDNGTIESRQYISSTGAMLPGLTLPVSFRREVIAARK